jgi:hypothetical protein
MAGLQPDPGTSNGRQPVFARAGDADPVRNRRHLYTTYIAAALAGIRAAGAAELAWGSQFPDAKRRFTGVSAA